MVDTTSVATTHIDGGLLMAIPMLLFSVWLIGSIIHAVFIKGPAETRRIRRETERARRENVRIRTETARIRREIEETKRRRNR